MKKNLFLIVFLVISAFACIKPSRMCGCVLPKPMLVTASKNDSSWTGSAFEAAGEYQVVKISAAAIPSYNKNNINDTLVMTINYIDGQTIYNLHSGDVYYHSAVTGGPVTAYQLDTLSSDNNTVTISQYDAHNDFIQGSFNLKFINPGKPDINFSGGKFQVRIN